MKQNSSVLALASIVVAQHDALITPAPRIRAAALRPVQRDVGDLTFNDPRLEGWQTLSGEIVQRTCNTGYTYSTRGNLYNCCATGVSSCSFANQCYGISSDIYANPPTTLACDQACITGTLYSNTADKNPLTHYGCGSYNYWIVQTSDSTALSTWTPLAAAVQTTPAAGTTTAKPTTAQNTGTTTTPTTAPGTTTIIGNPAATTNSAPAPTNTGSSHLGAIVGGVVGGGILLLAIILGCAYAIWRKRSRPAVAAPPSMQQYPPQEAHYAGQQQYTPQGHNQQHDYDAPPPNGDIRQSYVSPGSPPPMYGGQQVPQQGYYAPPKPMEPAGYPARPEAVELGTGR